MHTVFVVGAGASNEFDFPLGNDLRGKIRELLVRGPDDGWQKNDARAAVQDAIGQLYRVDTARASRVDRQGQLFSAINVIANGIGKVQSIDDLLRTHGDNADVVLLAKYAIAGAIAEAEAASPLRTEPNMPWSSENEAKIEVTWLGKLFKALFSGRTAAEVERQLERLTFVVFNYDRCVEQYFYTALRDMFAYSNGDEALTQLMAKLNVWHMYGTIGELRWQHRGGFAFSLGDEITATSVKAMATNLKTYHEVEGADSAAIREVRSRIASCTSIVFFGCAFHRQNLDLIMPRIDGVLSERVLTCLGTTKDIPPGRVKQIENDLRQRLGTGFGFNLDNVTCSKLLDDHGHLLS